MTLGSDIETLIFEIKFPPELFFFFFLNFLFFFNFLFYTILGFFYGYAFRNTHTNIHFFTCNVSHYT